MKNNDVIKGLKINNSEIIFSQLADDTTCIVKDATSLGELLRLLERFKMCAGLKVNVDKTIARGLGGYTGNYTFNLYINKKNGRNH